MSEPTLYIACSSAPAQRQRYLDAAQAATDAGFEVISSWLADVEREGAGNPDTLSVRIECAQKDIREILEAQALWLLAPPSPLVSHGAFFELGIAIRESATRRYPIVASGETKRSIFCSLVEEFDTDEAACNWLESADYGGEFGEW